ncbi:restriction endonuclease subunit S [Paenibacillus doosanensis]|uniref:restriction endonuclease subunit S n=1 Tax=Paenibacillus doosanensis TaxID=1229154 RepID=UPI00217F425F|nr:restriction endonuclease subunit S [Paenibacillus doosanensis]MCS7461215.1 restriction endonuclease subunit S [Paenibacillus doosanensis]
MATVKKKQNLWGEELLKQALVPEDEQPTEVPDNWLWVYGRIAFDKMESKRPTGDYFRYIDIESIDNKGQKVLEPKIIAVSEAPSRASRKLYTGSTLFSLVRPYLRNIAYIDESLSDCIASTGFYVCRPSKVFNSRYLFYLMTSDYVVNGLNAYMKGDNSPSIRKDDIENFAYPLPPLAEQQRIVDRIESLFAKLDQAKELAQNALDSFETRKAAILHKAFTGELTAKWRKEHGIGMDSWERKPIKEYVSKLNQGWSPKCETHPSESEDMWAVIKTTAIQHMHFNEMENKQLPSNLEPKIQHELQDGDILITRAGPRIRVGVCCLVKNVRPRLLLCDKAYRFNALGHKTIPEFLVYQLNTSSILDEINRMKTGISESGVNLTQEGFLSIEIVMPSLSEQKEVVRLLDGFLEREQRVNELINIIDKIDIMKKAILARAFRGELGTNNPNEESALELLKEVAQ